MTSLSQNDPPEVTTKSKTIDPREGDWKCSECGEHNFKRRTVCRGCPNVNPKNAEENEHPGDWKCVNCTEHNFARRKTCRKCQLTKEQAVVAHAANEKADKSNRPANWKRGDWICEKCEEHNFASRLSCRKCNKFREGSHTIPGENGLPSNWKPGDWWCGNCGDHQFASRINCRKCGSLRPNGGWAGGYRYNMYYPNRWNPDGHYYGMGPYPWRYGMGPGMHRGGGYGYHHRGGYGMGRGNGYGMGYGNDDLIRLNWTCSICGDINQLQWEICKTCFAKKINQRQNFHRSNMRNYNRIKSGRGGISKRPGK